MEGMESSFPCLGVQVGGNGMGMREHSFPPKLGGMGGNEIRFNDFFTKTPKIPLYIQLFILK